MSHVSSSPVMAGLVPAIHAFFSGVSVRVDARIKPGDDDGVGLVGSRYRGAGARKARDYAEADRIRAELDAMGIQLKDSKDPETGELKTTWEVKR